MAECRVQPRKYPLLMLPTGWCGAWTAGLGLAEGAGGGEVRIGSHPSARTSRAKRAFVELRGMADAVGRARSIPTLPTKVWKGTRVYGLTCQATFGRGPHVMYLPAEVAVEPHRLSGVSMSTPLKQQPLFDVEPELTCSFGTSWLDHWDPPVGTGKGCAKCATYKGEPTRPRPRGSNKGGYVN